jgi:RimJ/RimL family protein N-acetyltransferase
VGVVIQTERLILRRLTREDLDELVAIHADPDIIRFIGPFDRHRAVEWLERVDQSWAERGYGRVAITERATRRLLGRSGLMYLPEFEETELGWTLRRDCWGRGYATEAARACASWAFGHFRIPYVTSLIEPANDRSIQVARRLGMTPLRNDFYLDIPMVVHCLTRETWSRGETSNR